MTPAEAIETAEQAEAETAYRNQLGREMAAAAYERGLSDGYVRAIEDVKAAQHGIVRNAGLEIERYGPGGREHFGDPRPGDYPGRAARPEAEPELEAG
jgi:hypothetical protein